MANFTYFIISPGVDRGSFVQYPDQVQGNYIKFGDSGEEHESTQGVRRAYLTHNPDIGVMAVMDSRAIANPALGTLLKQSIMKWGYNPVGATEWFSIQAPTAWKLADAITRWDGAVITPANLESLLKTVKTNL